MNPARDELVSTFLKESRELAKLSEQQRDQSFIVKKLEAQLLTRMGENGQTTIDLDVCSDGFCENFGDVRCIKIENCFRKQYLSYEKLLELVTEFLGPEKGDDAKLLAEFVWSNRETRKSCKLVCPKSRSAKRKHMEI